MIITAKNAGDFAKLLQKQVEQDAKNIRFATMNALNDVAFKARQELINEHKDVFTVRNKGFPKAIVVTKATKQNLEAKIEHKAEFMKLHAYGGSRKPLDHSMIAIPLEKDAPGFRFESGKVKERNKPGELLKYYNANPIKTTSKSKVKRPFILKYDRYKAILIKRAKGNTKQSERKRGNGDKILFTFSSDAKIKKTYDFDNIITKAVDRNFDRLLDKRLKEAFGHDVDYDV